MNRTLHRLVLAAGLLVVAPTMLLPPVQAADPAAIPLSHFTRDDEFQWATLSPDGRHLAIRRPINGRSALQIHRLADLKPVGAFALKGDRDVNEIWWPNNEQVLFGTAQRLGSKGKLQRTGDLILMGIDGNGRRVLRSGKYRDYSIIDLLRDDPDNILIDQGDACRLNLRAGSGPCLMGPRARFARYGTDLDGRLRFTTGTREDGTIVVMFRETEDGSWDELGRFKPNSGLIWPLRFSRGGDQAFVAANVDTSTFGIEAFDLKFRQRKVVFRDPVYDAYEILRGRDYRDAIGVSWQGTRQQWKFFDEAHPDAILYRQLQGSLGNADLDFLSFSNDGSKAVVRTVSDVQPETFYVVDLATGSVLAGLRSRPWIDPAQMSPRQPIEFKARDGMLIRGYVTVPRARQAGERLPMIVLPHGGPHDARTTWSYDADAQMYASRGYVVLQPNFRGSGGYGKDFENAGYGQWGEAMQRDVFDATRWAMSQDYVDPTRICITGTGYGAYVALMAVALEPDLYRCAAGFAGIYDLRYMLKERLIWNREYRAYVERDLGTDKAELARRSPVSYADRIKVPVFLAHGEDDLVVPPEHFEHMRAALKAAGRPFEEMFVEDEGHGFSNEKHREELCTRLLAFFDRNIGAATSRSAPAP